MNPSRLLAVGQSCGSKGPQTIHVGQPYGNQVKDAIGRSCFEDLLGK